MSENGRQKPTSWWDGYLAALALVGILALLLMPPSSLLEKADRAGYAVCARIPGHIFVVAGRPLPLCARCSGTYLAALAGLAALNLRGRGRTVVFPPLRYVIIFLLFVLAWALDGVNSYLSLFPGLPHLYEPDNYLRLTTGVLEGLAMAAFLVPVLNLSSWVAPDLRPSVANWRDLAWMLVGGGMVFALVGSQWEPLLYPLALISGAAVVALIGAVNFMMLLILLRREGRATRWREIAAPALAAIALALAELWAIAAVRALLTERLRLPF